MAVRCLSEAIKYSIIGTCFAVALAAAVAAWRPRYAVQYVSNYNGWFVFHGGAPGFHLWIATAIMRDYQDSITNMAIFSPSPSPQVPSAIGLRGEGGGFVVGVVTVGWPFPCLAAYDIEPPDAATVRTRVTYSFSGILTGGVRYGERIFPMTPLVAPLCADAAVWGASAKLLASIHAALLRISRVKKGRCSACGYPACPGNVCPECGARKH